MADRCSSVLPVPEAGNDRFSAILFYVPFTMYKNSQIKNQVIGKKIIINAPVAAVLSLFTNPDIIRQMGGYYDTDWKTGSAFGFKKTGGAAITRGILLALKPMQLIKHSLFENDTDVVIAMLTYSFQQKDDQTMLRGQEELIKQLDQAGYDDASQTTNIFVYLSSLKYRRYENHIFPASSFHNNGKSAI